MKKPRAFFGQSKPYLAREFCKSFVKRAKRLMTEDFFIEEFKGALKEYEMELDYDANGELFFKEMPKVKPPSYEELMEFHKKWKDKVEVEQT